MDWKDTDDDLYAASIALHNGVHYWVYWTGNGWDAMANEKVYIGNYRQRFDAIVACEKHAGL
jgi:hypothetical protein